MLFWDEENEGISEEKWVFMILLGVSVEGHMPGQKCLF